MKKNLKKLLMCLVMSMLAIMLLSTTASAAPKLNKKKATLATGMQLQLKVKGAKGKVKWSSSKKSVASVSSSGVVKAKKKGKAVIKAKVKGKVLTCTVTVKKNAFENKYFMDWYNLPTCNNEFMYFIRGQVYGMSYNSKGELVAKVGIRNDTLGSNYATHYIKLAIGDANENIIAEGIFEMSSDYVVAPISVKNFILTFNGPDTKKVVDLTKLKKNYTWWITTYQS